MYISMGRFIHIIWACVLGIRQYPDSTHSYTCTLFGMRVYMMMMINPWQWHSGVPSIQNTRQRRWRRRRRRRRHQTNKQPIHPPMIIAYLRFPYQKTKTGVEETNVNQCKISLTLASNWSHSIKSRYSSISTNRHQTCLFQTYNKQLDPLSLFIYKNKHYKSKKYNGPKLPWNDSWEKVSANVVSYT